MPRFDALFYPISEEDGDVERFLDALPAKAASKCIDFIERLEQDGLILPSGWLEKVEGGDGLWALRPEWSNNEYRLFFTIVGVRAVPPGAATKPATTSTNYSSR